MLIKLNKKKYLILGTAIGIIGIAIFMIFLVKPGVEKSQKIKRGNLEVLVNCKGEVKGEKYTEINLPDIICDEELHVYQYKIADAIVEGKAVKKGDYIAKLDDSQLMTNMHDIMLEKEKMDADLRNVILDSTVNLSQRREAINNAKLDLEYLKIDLEPSKVAEVLTNIGLEIEGMDEWVSVKGGLEGGVIGEVLTCKKHPDADKLSVTTVDIGLEHPLQIVCGAPNVAAGQKVPVATIGTVVFKGNESLEIKKSKIRGELSEGMICAEDELGIGTSHAGIMVLESSAIIGTPAKEYLKLYEDSIFEIGLTPNRSDATSHIGVARDLFAVLQVQSSKFKVQSSKFKVLSSEF